jgi:hypothetical protein
MQRSINIGTYSRESGLRLEWVPDFWIAVAISGNDVTIAANAEGLRSLAQALLTLADESVPDGVHIHLEPGLELEDDSASLVLDRSQSWRSSTVRPD